jgi:hypothetical protein
MGIYWRGWTERRFEIWLVLAIAINAIAFLMMRAVHRPLVAYGAACDIAITVPALYFWLVVRPGVQPAVTMLPVCLLALLRAAYAAPGGEWMRPAAGAGAELAVAGYLVIRIRRGLRGAGPDEDIMQRMRLAAREVLRAPALAEIAVSELATFYYAFFSWRAKPHVPAGAQAFSIHRRSGVALLFGLFAGVGLIETAVVHLVIAKWSVVAAWVLTGLSVYGSVWLMAVARSFSLRPVLLTADELEIRSGLMVTVRVPLTRITEVRAGGFDGALKLPPAATPNVLVRFSEPVFTAGMYGIRRRISQVALAMDDPGAFTSALKAHLK